MRKTVIVLSLVLAAVATACRQEGKTPSSTSAPATRQASLTLTSPAFAQGAAIPKRFSGEGDDSSPPLAWFNVPAGTKEFAIVVDDENAPTGAWYHWLIYKIPAGADGLKEGISRTAAVADPAGAVQGRNSWGNVGYQGPMPPKGHGMHHYRFHLYALDAELPLQPAVQRGPLMKAIRGHVLAEAELMGTYQR